MRVITFKVNEELLRELDLFAANNKLYRSEVIRAAIEFYLSNYKSIEEKYSGRTKVIQIDNK